MKKLTREQIVEKFKEVVSPTNFFVFGEDGILLSGKYCSDELREISRVMDEINHGTDEEKEVSRIQSLEIKGFRNKDIKVVWGCEGERDRLGNKEYTFSFYIMKDEKEYDFYYGHLEPGASEWWPSSTKRGYLSPIHEFIPDKFSECCENMYNFRGTLEQALELLTECGFTVEKGNDYD